MKPHQLTPLVIDPFSSSFANSVIRVSTRDIYGDTVRSNQTPLCFSGSKFPS
ncbi:hypothetical protein CY34DRAFT_804099 [Suillus luteus UH-Slu-Lm8-n1]|uniref:Uncharacterized protein n=1 Tax=Suillus luteus UH-Slu-Lm8-n1 TaxID=930992 RepID=A0A0D0B9Y2_9AGAM|nr:hypothetical protein CY34DRAFT_804099 [Suillus luteus UH-Slu-Lm8-n1]